jgi:hypothetical protein
VGEGDQRVLRWVIVALAFSARWDVSLFKFFVHIGPVVTVAEGSVAFVGTKMTGGIMCKAEEILADVADSWYEEAVANVPQTIGLASAIGHAIADEFLTEWVSGITGFDFV